MILNQSSEILLWTSGSRDHQVYPQWCLGASKAILGDVLERSSILGAIPQEKFVVLGIEFLPHTCKTYILAPWNYFPGSWSDDIIDCFISRRVHSVIPYMVLFIQSLENMFSLFLTENSSLHFWKTFVIISSTFFPVKTEWL